MAEEFDLWSPKKRLSPRDSVQYILPKALLRRTEKVLREYGAYDPPHEGLVYWGGTRSGERVEITSIVAPKAKSRPQGIEVPRESYFEVIRALNKRGIIQVGQVHSHPGTWVDHSSFDDRGACSRVEGMLSIVIPSYAQQEVEGVSSCGVHRFAAGEFIRLSDDYAKEHFNVTGGNSVEFVDLR